ncbi:unnamed protein product [Mortierella alpina]
MDDSGFFSVQVLSHALSIWNIQIVPWGAEEVSDAKAEPEREAAFICNLEQHWYTLRRFGPSTQRWYDLNSLHPRPQHMSATYLGMTLSQLEAEGYSIFVVRPLIKDDNVSATTTAMPAERATSPAATETTPSLPLKNTEPTATSTSTTPLPAAVTGFLSERQEMERIRRQRLEERERASQQSVSSSPTPAAAIDTFTAQKRTRVEPAEGGGTGKETRRPSTSVLVTTPSFLPRCEVDEMAATMPLQNAPSTLQEPSKDHTPAFGGTGHRLGGSQSAAVDDNFDGVNQGFGGDNDDDDADLEAQMMQQAIAMSLQGSQK